MSYLLGLSSAILVVSSAYYIVVGLLENGYIKKHIHLSQSNYIHHSLKKEMMKSKLKLDKNYFILV